MRAIDDLADMGRDLKGLRLTRETVLQISTMMLSAAETQSEILESELRLASSGAAPRDVRLTRVEDTGR